MGPHPGGWPCNRRWRCVPNTIHEELNPWLYAGRAYSFHTVVPDHYSWRCCVRAFHAIWLWERTFRCGIWFDRKNIGTLGRTSGGVAWYWTKQVKSVKLLYVYWKKILLSQLFNHILTMSWCILDEETIKVTSEYTHAVWKLQWALQSTHTFKWSPNADNRCLPARQFNVKSLR